MKMTIKAALLAATISGLAALPAQAQTANTVVTSVNARAGLAPLTSVSCTPVDFGVWRVPVRAAGRTGAGTTTVTLTESGGITTATLGGVDTTNVALATTYPAPTAGACSVVGAMNLNNSDQVSISGHQGMTFTSSNHNSLNRPSNLAALRADLTTVNSVAISALGTGNFTVVGVLTIPSVIVAQNYGGYTTTEPATVTVFDIIPA